MKFHSKELLSKASDLLIVPVWSSGDLASLDTPFSTLPPLEKKDFPAKEGTTLLSYWGDQRVLLLGLGSHEKCTEQTLREAYGKGVVSIADRGFNQVELLLPLISQLAPARVLRGAVEGAMFAAYRFEVYLTKKETPISSFGFLAHFDQAQEIIDQTAHVFSGVNLARDLVNTNADQMNPDGLVAAAEKIAKEEKVKCKVWRRKELQAEGFHLILAVGRGAESEPALIELTYTGAPKSEERTVLIGKGITYDTGGLCIKTGPGMVEMKGDMAGAAAVLGTMEAAARLKLPINVTGLIASAENAVDGKSYKPGDVYFSHAKKWVEIVNTDAEGRLVLADALSYAASHLKPTRIIDFATLTGAVEIALGSLRAGLFSSDEALTAALRGAGERSGELVWPMPLDEGYGESLKSSLADIKHCGDRKGGAIVAAKFLQAFVPEGLAWSHLDIAGVTFQEKPKGYHRSNATGYGVRLAVEFLNGL